MVTFATNIYEVRNEPTVQHSIAETSKIALDTLCSIDRIRTHTKTDDVPWVTDDQLMLYRAAAFEAAEQYSGLLLTMRERIEETIKLPRNYTHDTRRTFKHTLRFPTANGRIFVYGPGLSREIDVGVGIKRLSLPNIFQGKDFQQCCSPCNVIGGSDYKIMYLAGFSCAEDVPAGIIVGVLKYIAWSVENPGDVYMTVNNTTNNSTAPLSGTNNVAWASGALELWRQYNNQAF